MYKATVSTKGQIVIPADLRKRLSLNRGATLRLYLDGRKIVAVPEVDDPVSHGLGLLKAANKEERGNGAV